MLTCLATVSADNGIRCAIPSSAAHPIPLSALAAGKMVNDFDMDAHKYFGDHGGVSMEKNIIIPFQDGKQNARKLNGSRN